MYYSGNKKFTSKFDAVIHFNKTKEETNFYYYDDVYDKIDWTIEPPETLEFYYKEQAKRIRESYDYVILCFSGGADSTNILETFYYNNLKIDKIITVGAFSQDSHSMVEENHNGEIYFVAHPRLKELGLESITEHFDYTKYFDKFSQFSINEYGSEWFKYCDSWFSPHHWFWRDLPKYVVPRNMENKKVGIVFGIDKPSFSFDKKNRLSFRFHDAEVQQYGNIKYKNDFDKINFYWDPESPLIVIKQLHILKKAFNIKRTIRKDNFRGVQIISDISVNDLIYNLKKPLNYITPKSKSPFLSIRDEYIKNKKDSDVYKFYMSGIMNVHKELGLNNYIGSISTKFYSLE